MAIAALDAVTQEILSSAFHHIAEEMAVVEYRSSYSPIIREMLDFNCGLFTADGRMVANSAQIPAQLGLIFSVFFWSYALLQIPVGGRSLRART